MKKTFSLLLAFLTIIFLILLCAEGLVRLSYKIVDDPGALATARYLQSAQANVYRLWNSGPKEDPFLPPFHVFGNRNAVDVERLKEIAQQAKLPTERTVESFDFLRFDEKPENTRYTVHTNSLGFRGIERKVAKPKGVFRIISLGSYQTFGLGVNDQETFSAQLEEILNQRKQSGRKYEVWNGGRPAGTAIIGLARLQTEIFAYQPDLIILDYGFIDLQTFDDDVFPGAMSFPRGFTGALIRSILMPTLTFFEHSYLAGRIAMAISTSPYRRNDGSYQDVMARIAKICLEQGVPLIYLSQIGNPPLSGSVALGTHISVLSAFADHPPTPGQYKNAISQSWVRHLPPQVLNHQTFNFFPYRLNVYQLNKDGHHVIAQALAREVEALVAKHEAP